MNTPHVQNFELAKLHCDRGDYLSAMPILTELATHYYHQKNFDQYLKCQNLLLRIHAERDELEQINFIKEKIQDLVLKEGFDLSSHTYYTLGICASHKEQFDLSLDYAQKALSIALLHDKKEDICRAIFLLAMNYMRLNRYEESLKELYNLEVFFQIYNNLVDIKIAAKSINAEILRRLNKFEESIEICWQAYDELKTTKHLTLSNNILYQIGVGYYGIGDFEMARLYLGLADRGVDPRNQVILHRLIKYYLEKSGGKSESKYDLIYEESTGIIQEKKLGKVDFKNQFILLDLLRLFMKNQGVVYSKEYLVENVWKENYDPELHDNKIYVTIKRLRKLIEPDLEKPKYIFRAKNGYFMNKSATVQLNEKQH